MFEYAKVKAFGCVFIIHDLYERRIAVELVRACDCLKTYEDCLEMLKINFRKETV